MRTPIGIDPACETLAEHFLQDEPALANRKLELAARIQNAVEGWFEDEKPEADDGVDPTTSDLFKPRGNRGVVDNDICYNALLLVGDTDPNLSQISQWSQDQRDRAYDWAMRVHLQASDNDDVFVPPRPDFVRRAHT